jgi:NADPH2:quinone reductase
MAKATEQKRTGKSAGGKTRRAVAIDRFGGVEELKFRELPAPETGDGEVLIRVESAGVGVWDPFELEGGFAKEFGMQPDFPYVIGADGAGTVEQVGGGVQNLSPGDRVYGMALMNPKGGFYAETVAVKADNVAKVPDKLSTRQAGALAVDAITALRGLVDTLGLKSGETILILGASGGIGHLAVQLAKRLGARVFAVASGDDGVALAKRLGADEAIDGKKEDIAAAARRFAPQGIDTALLTAGGKAAEQALAAVHQGGRAAYPNGVEPAPKERPGVTLKSYDGMPDRKIFETLNQLIEKGPFEVEIAKTFPLAQAAEAHRALAEHYLGKIALTP